MTEFDPETFEEEKYREHFTELQRAYKDAFDVMTDEYDSDLIHALDQQVLNESEPHFVDGQFEIELPEKPIERISAISAEESTLTETLEAYTDQIAEELHTLFDVERPENDA